MYFNVMRLLPILIAMITGILFGGLHPIIPSFAYIMIILLTFLSFAFVKNRYVWIILISTLMLLISIRHAMPVSDLCINEALSYGGDRKLVISGWIVEPVTKYPDREKLILKIDKIDGRQDVAHSCLVQLFIFNKDKQPTSFILGDYISFVSRLKKPKNLKNPGSFDFTTFLSRKGISLITYINNPDDVTIIKKFTEKGLSRIIDSIRAELRNIITKNTNDPVALGIISALVIGDQGYITPDVRKIFASTGIIHIIVVAGLHLSIITHLFYLLIKFILSRSTWLCLRTNIPKLSFILSMIPMVVYIFITGAHPPVVRSGIMIAVYCFMFIINRSQSKWTGIFAAAIFILTIDPMALYSISFQLSFIAVGSIIAFMPVSSFIISKLKAKIPWNHSEIIMSVLNILLISLFVTIGLGAVIALYFNTLPLFGIVLNVIVIPVFGYLIVPISLLASASAFVFPLLSHALFFILSFLIKEIVNVIHAISELPGASIRVATPTLFEICLYYLTITILLNTKKIGLKTTSIILFPILFLQIMDAGYFFYRTHYNKELSITFIDVGQGDSAFVELPYGKTLLVDGGGGAYQSYDTGEAVVARYIWTLKRTTVDYVIASHPQIDHIGGLCFIVKNMGVKEIYKSDCEPATKIYKDLMKTIHETGANFYTIKDRTSMFYVNGVKIELFPVPHDICDPASQKDVNNFAVVTKITYKDVSLLFTGDIEKKAEELLVNTYQLKLKAKILKVAHHGSKTSSTDKFLDAVNPLIAVISVGEENPFHMPSKYVLKRLFERHISVLRTDRDGAIMITTDGKHINIKTYASRYVFEL